MKIRLVQMNSKVGDFDANSRRMSAALEQADASSLVVFPECCLTGYPQQDLLEYKAFAEKAERYALELVKKHRDKSFVFGSIERNTDKGRPMRNIAVFASGGEVKSKYSKRLLPSYDVFDEDRFFEAGREACLIEFQGKKLALTICEDIWSHALLPHLQNRYHQDALEKAAEADIILNLSASPFEFQKLLSKREMLSRIAKTYKKPLVYVNCIGANDGLIFDGRSYVWNSKGELCVELASFGESELDVDISSLEARTPEPLDEIKTIYDALILGIRDYCEKSGFESVVVGMSGGIDSSLVTCLAADALGAKNVTGVMMPSRFTSKESNEDALSMAIRMQNPLHLLHIEEMFGAFLHTMEKSFEGKAWDFTEENMQSRMRGAILMAIANKNRSLVLTTGNKSELAVGYCTLYGDMNGALAPICDVYKHQVYELAREANRREPRIPERVFTKAPSAELKEGQKDQDYLPPYDLLDQILYRLLEKFESRDEICAAGFDAETVDRVMKLYSQSEYKRFQMPLGLKVSSKAFGIGRRIPLVQGFL